jgi:putative spermidine/putrescine transport system permease protein
MIHLPSLAAGDPNYQPLWDGLKSSVFLVILTVAIMVLLLVPTMTWVRLRAPWLNRTLEFICLLPLIIPAIVLVVGLAPIYRFIAVTTGSIASVWLCLAYVVLVLPFAYRALDAGLAAIDVKTLSEAARSLGSGWGAIMVRIILPNIRTAVVSACFLAVALVLGEFTIANLLSRNNLQTGIFLVAQADGRLAVAMSLTALVLGFLLLLVLSFVSGRQRGERRD